MDKIIVFETFYDPIAAHMVKSRLLDAGIQCFLADENMGSQIGYNQAIGGVKLNLFERDVEAAKAILAADL
ncbi:DUF2007 domain-containing protein [Pedobacter heparinus]|uniref:putative signal transducing protein n=1 Tax=Pedobacter heparinus TaxID=984 RepID=UPI002931CD2A|nr:DUF2007 domain-containing protein [Pedobacter heparinus]